MKFLEISELGVTYITDEVSCFVEHHNQLCRFFRLIHRRCRSGQLRNVCLAFLYIKQWKSGRLCPHTPFFDWLRQHIWYQFPSSLKQCYLYDHHRGAKMDLPQNGLLSFCVWIRRCFSYFYTFQVRTLFAQLYSRWDFRLRFCDSELSTYSCGQPLKIS